MSVFVPYTYTERVGFKKVADFLKFFYCVTTGGRFQADFKETGFAVCCIFSIKKAGNFPARMDLGLSTSPMKSTTSPKLSLTHFRKKAIIFNQKNDHFI